MRPEIRRERVLRPDEEAACEWCGFPMYVGDPIWYTPEFGAFCGRVCAREREEHELFAARGSARGNPRAPRFFTAHYRWRSVGGIGPTDHFETISATSLAAAKRVAKAMEGAEPRTWLMDVYPAGPDEAPRGNPARSLWRKRQIILEPALVERLFDWHGGQWSFVYALASTGMEDLVSLSMIHAALGELESMGAPREPTARGELEDLIGDLDGAYRFWRENTARAAGMDIAEDEYEYDRRDYGDDEETEREMAEDVGAA